MRDSHFIEVQPMLNTSSADAYSMNAGLSRVPGAVLWGCLVREAVLCVCVGLSCVRVCGAVLCMWGCPVCVGLSCVWGCPVCVGLSCVCVRLSCMWGCLCGAVLCAWGCPVCVGLSCVCV